MAKITINFTDETKYTRDLNAFCDEYGYKVEDGTKQAFVEDKLKTHFKQVSKERRLRLATQLLTVED